MASNQNTETYTDTINRMRADIDNDPPPRIITKNAKSSHHIHYSELGGAPLRLRYDNIIKNTDYEFLPEIWERIKEYAITNPEDYNHDENPVIHKVKIDNLWHEIRHLERIYPTEDWNLVVETDGSQQGTRAWLSKRAVQHATQIDLGYAYVPSRRIYVDATCETPSEKMARNAPHPRRMMGQVTYTVVTELEVIRTDYQWFNSQLPPDGSPWQNVTTINVTERGGQFSIAYDADADLAHDPTPWYWSDTESESDEEEA